MHTARCRWGVLVAIVLVARTLKRSPFPSDNWKIRSIFTFSPYLFLVGRRWVGYIRWWGLCVCLRTSECKMLFDVAHKPSDRRMFVVSAVRCVFSSFQRQTAFVWFIRAIKWLEDFICSWDIIDSCFCQNLSSIKHLGRLGICFRFAWFLLGWDRAVRCNTSTKSDESSSFKCQTKRTRSSYFSCIISSTFIVACLQFIDLI